MAKAEILDIAEKPLNSRFDSYRPVVTWRKHKPTADCSKKRYKPNWEQTTNEWEARPTMDLPIWNVFSTKKPVKHVKNTVEAKAQNAPYSNEVTPANLIIIIKVNAMKCTTCWRKYRCSGDRQFTKI